MKTIFLKHISNCKQLLAFGLMLTALTAITSCKKLIEVKAPTNTLVTTSVFGNDGTAIAAQLSVYGQMIVPSGSASPTWDLEYKTGVSSDELINYNSRQSYVDLYANALQAQTDASTFGYWRSLYNYIYQENAILENVPKSTGMSTRVKQLMTGEAYFMRGYFYFLLANLYGNVPIVTSTDYTINSTLPQESIDKVYQQIMADLERSKPLLSSTYLDASDNTGAADKIRPTTWAADALLARVYLYYANLSGDASYFAKAYQQASAVIDGGPFSLETDLNQVFKATSKEAIWQLMPPTGTLTAPEGTAFILTANPSAANNGNSQTSLSSQLLNAFESNDLRKVNWISNYTENGTTWYFPYKYKDGKNYIGTLEEYSMVLRLAEPYLVRAEAEANGAGNGINGAITDLNTIRNRAGLPNYIGGTDKASLLTTIMHERQVELFTEGHRWFDLKRTKTIDAVMGIVTPQKQPGTVWNSYQQLFPLNPDDLRLNPKLIQNKGY